MSEAQSLAGLTVLVTRPQPQGSALSEMIKESGGNVVYFPTIAIEPRPLDASQDIIPSLDWLIFVSPQAVYQLTTSSRGLSAGSSSIKIAAIGGGTADALRAAGLFVHLYPKENWNSEGLLSLEAFQDVAGKKIGIVKGEEGREELEKTLKSRGAHVIPLVVYKRQLPSPPPQDMLDLLRHKKINVIICTSVDGVKNLKKLFSLECEKIKTISLLVISERMQKAAESLGFKKIINAPNATHHAIIATLKKEKENIMANETSSKNKNVSWYLIGTLMTALALVLLVFLFLASNYFYIHYLSAQNVSLLRMQDTQTHFKSLKNDVAQLNEELKTQQTVINSLRQTQSGYNRNEWRVLEAEFLAKMANDRLQLDSNPAQALILLQNADQQLKEVSDENLLPIRKALASDIAALQSVPQLDLPGYYLRLSALNAEVDKLALPNKPAEVKVVEAQDNKLPWWRRGLQDTWASLKKIVVVRYHEQGSPALIMPEQKDFLYQNIHAALEKAMWALLNRQPEIYRASLQQAMNWIRQYFIMDLPVTQSLLTNLTQLEAVNINPSLPKLNNTLQAFQEYFAAHPSHSDQPA